MKLLISRDTSDVYSRFVVYDENENLLYSIKGKDNTAVKKIKAFTPEGKCLLKISATPEIGSTIGYNIITPEGAFALTVRLKPDELCLKILGTKLFFRGNLITRSFEITDVSAKALAFHKPEAGKSGRYVLEVIDEAQVFSLLAISICADLISFSDSAYVCRA